MSVIDLEAAVKFYEMRIEILSELYTLCGFLGNMADPIYYNRVKDLIHKIESLGKKEK